MKPKDLTDEEQRVAQRFRVICNEQIESLEDNIDNIIEILLPQTELVAELGFNDDNLANFKRLKNYLVKYRADKDKLRALKGLSITTQTVGTYINRYTKIIKTLEELQ